MTPPRANESSSPGGGSPSGRRKSSSISQDEFAKISQEPKDFYPVEEDTWGVAIMSIVKDYGDILERKAHRAQVIQFIIALITLALNIFIQLSMLIWVKKYVVNVATHDSQVHYAAYKATLFTTEGGFNDDGWQSYDGKGAICDCALSKRKFLMAILFLWGLRILMELRTCEELFSRIHSLHSLPKGAGPGDMVLEKRDANQQMFFDIVALTPTARCGIYVLIVLPKIAIALVLFYSGVVWLTATDSFYALIMNALALEFIMNIDEVCYNAVFPPLVQKTLKRTQFATPKPTVNPTKDRKLVLSSYALAGAQLMIVIIMLEMYLSFFQTVLPGYKWDIASHCSEFVAFSVSKVCKPEAPCFPFGKQQHGDSGALAAYDRGR